MSNKYLEKIASPKWVKYLRSLSQDKRISEAVKLSSKVPNKVREIAPIGKGSIQIVDQVYLPSHGVAVRKIPQLTNVDPGHITYRKKQHAAAKEFLSDVRDITGGRGPFAHAIKTPHSSPSSSYSEYSIPKKKEISGILRRNLEEASGEGFNYNPSRINKLTHYSYNEGMVRKRLSVSDVESLDLVKKKYPKLRDIRADNFVGGKIVDMESGIGGGMPLSPIKADIPENKITAVSKRYFLGRNKNT